MNKRIVMLGLMAFVSLMGLTACKDEAKVSSISKTAKPIKVMTGSIQSFKSTRKVSGVSSALNDIIISSQANGVVEWMGVDLGDRVSAQMALAKVEPDMAKAQVAAAKAGFELARHNYQVQQSLFKKKLASEQQYKMAASQFASARANYDLAKLQFENTTIQSSINGILAEKYIDQGEFVNAGRPVFRVIDITKIKVNIGISGQDLLFLSKGQSVAVIFPAISEKEFSGWISAVGNVAHPDSKTFAVEVVVDNPNQVIKSGMLCQVQFVRQSFARVMVIPQDVILDDEITAVFVARNGVALKHKINILGREDHLAAIQGLRADEKIIYVGQDTLNHGEPVTIVQ